YYGDRPVFSDFSDGPPTTSFVDTPYAYMVRREEFDDILLKNAAASGAAVFQDHSVVDLVRDGERVRGVVVRDDNAATRTVHCDMLFDCSGFGAIVPRKFDLRRENRLKRMAVFGQYETTPLNEDLKNGWFVGQMVYDGWLWLIPLKENLISIGVVIPVTEYHKANQSAQDFLESYIRRVPIAQTAITPNPRLDGKVHLYGNLGYTTTRAFGEGWVLVGDAAFFIDPCYSTGVHLALSSAKHATRLYLDYRRTGGRFADIFAEYERDLRRDERLVLRFVDAFYMATRNRVLKWLVPVGNLDFINRSFVGVTGGDFQKHPVMINSLYWASKAVSTLFPVPARAI
ncbi:MAG: NAD(P)/FAD-dependent oxidoreductase, partial [Stellaceae bacterium]